MVGPGEAHGLERERTFDVPVGRAAEVATMLWQGDRDLRVGARTYRRGRSKDRLRAYFFPVAEPPVVRRVIVRLSGRRFRARESTKAWRGTLEGPRKFHERDTPIPDLEALSHVLRQAPILAAFVKAKRASTYTDARTGRPCFTVSLDRMVPFAPDAPEMPGEPFVHLEFEATGAWYPAILLAPGATDAPLDRLHLTTASKLHLARMGPPVRLGRETRIGMATYLDRVRRHASTRLGGVQSPLLPIHGRDRRDP